MNLLNWLSSYETRGINMLRVVPLNAAQLAIGLEIKLTG